MPNRDIDNTPLRSKNDWSKIGSQTTRNTQPKPTLLEFSPKTNSQRQLRLPSRNVGRVLKNEAPSQKPTYLNKNANTQSAGSILNNPLQEVSSPRFNAINSLSKIITDCKDLNSDEGLHRYT